MNSSKELFDTWYVRPLNMLRLTSTLAGDGTFIALATALFLYERYAKTILNKTGKKADDSGLFEQFAVDFNTDKDTSQLFWNIMRNGILHQAMPKQKDQGKNLPYWAFNNSFLPAIEITTYRASKRLNVNPWRIIDIVIDLWNENLAILEESDAFPWANVYNDDESGKSSSIVTGSVSGLGDIL